ncbi:MAG: inositol monophosphatase [Acidimicrobiales bacterium]|nr:inositol monophosphatase [Acidimicrobiales bacterium]
MPTDPAAAGPAAPAPDPDPAMLLRLATSIAEEAGQLLLERLDQERTAVATKSSLTDMVTDADRASEALILGRLGNERPGDEVLTEEAGDLPGSTRVRWVVDPLDGTTNYLYRFPAWSVSVAAQLDGATVAGAVRDPARAITFSALAGHGSWQNGQPLLLSSPPPLERALVGTGFAYDAGRRAWQAQVLTAVLPAVRDVRRAGSAALDLCFVGAGHLDAFYESGIQAWDRAAGLLVASEAGAWVGGLDGGPPTTELTIATHPALAEPLRQLLARAWTEAPPPRGSSLAS